MRRQLGLVGLALAGIIAGAAFVITPVSAVESFDTSAPVIVPIDSDGVQRTTIVVDSYSYTPSHLQVEVGKPVELILNSVTIITPHNFVLKEPGAGLMLEQDVPTGKETIVRFTPTQPGLFKFYCDKKLLFFKSHRDKGMEGLLDVR
ncbi:MAG: cupredoxin domain-containing protein [Nitrospirales bacterium]|nr:cupredoxin domain-containing protein [Nitrospirales bacterium]